jgi:Phage virion morphogenesis family
MAPPVPHGGAVGVSVDATRAVAKIGRLRGGLAVRDILEAIGAKELRWTGLNLQKAGKVESGFPWQVMAPMTLRMRPRRPSTHHFSSPYQTLLQQSMTSEVNEGTATVSVGTNARYAIKHHEGDPSTNLPARKLVGTPGPARLRALQVIDAIVAKLKQAASR